MRVLDTNLIIVPYVQFHQLDLSKIKIRQLNHLFDVDPTKRNSNKRTRADAQDANPSSVNSYFLIMVISVLLFYPMDMATSTQDSLSLTVSPLQTAIGHNTASSTAGQSLKTSFNP